MSNYIERYWRDATPQDAVVTLPMVARFKDYDDGRWMKIDKLFWWDRSEMPWHDCAGHCYDQCQVYDAPDPGEGWRLIDPYKEQPEEHDQYLCPISNLWCFCNECLGGVGYSKDSVVRRRIEQPKPEPKYVPFTWEDREQLRGRWVIDGEGDEQCIIRLDQYQEVLIINDNPADKALEEWNFADTGEPVGKRVQ